MGAPAVGSVGSMCDLSQKIALRHARETGQNVSPP